MRDLQGGNCLTALNHSQTPAESLLWGRLWTRVLDLISTCGPSRASETHVLSSACDQVSVFCKYRNLRLMCLKVSVEGEQYLCVCMTVGALSAHSGSEAQGGRSAGREAVASSQTQQAVKALSASSPPPCQSHKTLQRWTRQHNIDAFPFSHVETRDQTALCWQKSVCRVGFVLSLFLFLHCTCHPFQWNVKEGC